MMATLTTQGRKVTITLTGEELLWLSSYSQAAIDIDLIGLESEAWSARPLMRSPRRVWSGPGNYFVKRSSKTGKAT